MRKLVSLLFVFGILFVATPGFAQSQGGIAVSPPSLELKANQGEVVKNSIKIENITNKSIELEIFAQNFTAFGDGGQIALTEEDSSFSLVDWIELSEDRITIQPKSAEIVTFELNIPKNAEPGSHYGAIVFRASNTGIQDSSGASVTAQVGSLILLRLPGRVYENARINSFTSTKQFITDETIQLNASVENTGNVHVKPYGFIAVKNIFGWKEKTFEVRGKNVLPGSKRLFDEQIKLSGIGIYTAELTLLYSDGGGVMKQSTQFVALPVKRLTPYLVGLVVVTVFFVLFRKRIAKALGVLVKG